MALIDSDFIRAANDRLQWDGIWEDSVLRIHREGRSAHDVLDDAILTLFGRTGGGKPRLILCSWAFGRELLLEARERGPEGHFKNAAAYEAEAAKRAFQYDFDAQREHLFERGYLGTYGGAVIIASIYLGVQAPNWAIVASVLEPGKVDYDGSNCLIVDLG